MPNRFRAPILTLIIILITNPLTFLINTSPVAQTFFLGAADEIDGQPVWDNVVVSILGSPEDAPDLSKLAPPEGHLGWDSATHLVY